MPRSNCYHLFLFVGFGHYVPKAFYTIDEDGNQSPIVFIDSIPVRSSKTFVNKKYGFFKKKLTFRKFSIAQGDK